MRKAIRYALHFGGYAVFYFGARDLVYPEYYIALVGMIMASFAWM